jgi:serine protease Do
MGVQIQPVTADIANSLGLKTAEGALVDEPQANSPAAKAGIKSGDVITALDGKTVKDSRELARRVGAMSPGTSVKLDLLHQGESKTVTLTLGQVPNDRQTSENSEQTQPESGVPTLGLALAPASEVAGSGGRGVVVMGVEPNGSAAEHGLQQGDIILDVGGKAVAHPSEVRKALTEAKWQGKNDVLMRVKSANATKFVALPIDNINNG